MELARTNGVSLGRFKKNFEPGGNGRSVFRNKKMRELRMKISVFGIGYVGAVTSACLADSGHEVIAVDTSPVKVLCLREGRSPIVEKGLGELTAKGVETGRLKATEDFAQAVRDT